MSSNSRMSLSSSSGRIAYVKRGKSIVVAGGAGFLGSHLCRKLLRSGACVICVDALWSGRFANISALLKNPAFSFIEHDIVEPLRLPQSVHEIYNLACVASPRLYQAEPIRTFKTNVIGGLNLLELAQTHGARLLQSSTSEVYGDPEIDFQSEDYRGNVNCYGPRACYDEGKRAVETAFYDYRERRGVVTKIARIFNTYGPRMLPDDGRVVSNFIVQALRGDDITIYGDGTQTRSFCYVDDLVDGLVRLMQSPPELHQPINLGNPNEITVRTLAEDVIRITGSPSRIVYRDLPVDDPHRRRPDISRARAALGWVPSISLEMGLKRTVDYFAKVLCEDIAPAELAS